MPLSVCSFFSLPCSFCLVYSSVVLYLHVCIKGLLNDENYGVDFNKEFINR